MNNIWFILLCMIFMHLMADYFFQGCLADLKQKSWWIENYNEKKYKNDYVMALFEHSFMWTFFIMLPVAFYLNFNFKIWFFLAFFANIIYHADVDNMKANDRSISLITDQLLHLYQIIMTWFVMMLIM